MSSLAEWINARTQRRIDDKIKSHAEVAQRLEELRELQDSWCGEVLKVALTTARQLLCEHPACIRTLPCVTWAYNDVH